jgi:hypothetical protein
VDLSSSYVTVEYISDVSLSTANALPNMNPRGMFSNTVKSYVDCVNTGALSFTSVTMMVIGACMFHLCVCACMCPLTSASNCPSVTVAMRCT